MKIVPDQIAPWVPGGLTTLGTDGFGRSDTRENLRRFFEVDAESTVIATLYALRGCPGCGGAGDQGIGCRSGKVVSGSALSG
jgi:pyruvate dehydrogenase complex dehydrogenase (E1) component